MSEIRRSRRTVAGAYGFRNFELNENVTYAWDGITSDVLNFALISDYEWSRHLNIGFDFKYSDENFVTTDGLNVSLKKASLVSAALSSHYKFYESSAYSSRLLLAMENPILGFSDLKPGGTLGYSVGMDLSFHKLIPNQTLNLGLIYGIKNLDTIQNEQQESFFGFKLSIQTNNWF